MADHPLFQNRFALTMTIRFMILSLLSVLFTAESQSPAYNTGQGVVPDKLNVHLVAHSHDDVGWLKTVDQYYLGANNSIQLACVKNVLDSMVPALVADKNRRFIYVEMAFFKLWWRDQRDPIKNVVKKLVSSGQLEFVNGGMCMHDEAVTHYIDMIDQTTLGHKFIKEEFNVTPRAGWQIDPFGHSAVQAYLLGAEVGFDSFFYARIDYQDREKRKNEKSLEVIWRGSKSLGSSAQIFAGAFPKNYEPPTTDLYFEVSDTTPIVQDNVDLCDYNVPERVNDFVAAAVLQANITRGNHIMFTMGTDFKYQFAETWFRQMDRFIHHVNEDGRVNALYSTPSIYADAKHAENKAWPIKTEDFFPYADSANGYWTGYFSSRPALKHYIRVMSGYYLAARQLEFFIGRSKSGPNTDLLGEALAIAQHHDAVTGTAKQHVTNDYAKRLAMGQTEAGKVVASSLACLAESTAHGECGSSSAKFQQCPLLNISYCPASEIDLSQGKSLVVVVYNSLGWKRDDIVRIPVINEHVAVHDSKGKEIESQLLPVVDSYMAIRQFHLKAYLGGNQSETPKYSLAFAVSLPPLGFNTYTVSSSKKPGATSTRSSVQKNRRSQTSSVEVGKGKMKLTFTGDQGTYIRYHNGRSLVEENVEHSYGFYSCDDGAYYGQNGGAYIFRPSAKIHIEPETEVSLTVLRGSLVDEVHQQINPWISQVTRVYKAKEHVEVEFTVGPIPADDYVGKDVVTHISTSMGTNKTFHTDSSGRDFIKRIRDHRTDWNLDVNEPVSGNYYPINLGIYMQDDKKEFSVLVDRPIGGSSIKDGQVELMLHRRLLLDDSKGVNEALNETVCVDTECKGLTVRGKYYFRIDPHGEGAKWRRSFGQEIYSPLLLAFIEQDGNNWVKSHVATFSAIDFSYTLPENVAIITLQELAGGNALLRLAHLYEVGEDKDHSVPASVDLKKLFPHRKISKVKEMSLSANQEKKEMVKKRLRWKVEGHVGEEAKSGRGKPVDHHKLEVELFPMEIRTFFINFKTP